MLNKNLIKFRESTGLSQKQFSENLGYKQNTYNGYETGKREIKTDLLGKISVAYGVSVDYLLGISKTPYLELSKDETQEKLFAVYLVLNQTAKQKLLNYAEDLSKIEEYRAQQKAATLF